MISTSAAVRRESGHDTASPYIGVSKSEYWTTVSRSAEDAGEALEYLGFGAAVAAGFDLEPITKLGLLTSALLLGGGALVSSTVSKEAAKRAEEAKQEEAAQLKAEQAKQKQEAERRESEREWKDWERRESGMSEREKRERTERIMEGELMSRAC